MAVVKLVHGGSWAGLRGRGGGTGGGLGSGFGFGLPSTPPSAPGFGGGGGGGVEVVLGTDRPFLLKGLAPTDATAVLPTVGDPSAIELPTAVSTISSLSCGTTLSTIAAMEHPMATSEMARMRALTHVQRGEPVIMKLEGRFLGCGRLSGVMSPRSASDMVAFWLGMPLVVNRPGESGGESGSGMSKALKILAEKFCRRLEEDVDKEACDTRRRW